MPSRPFKRTIGKSSLRIPTLQAAILSLAMALSCPGALAQSSDAEFAALFKANKRPEAEALARERLATHSGDVVALWYLGRAIIHDAKKREDLIPVAEKCVKEMPNAARCHNLLATLLGARATTGGAATGLKYVGTIGDLMIKAVELDPNHFESRRDLIQYYLQAPGLLGGSVRKAREHAEAYRKLDELRGQILQSAIYAYEKDWAKAEDVLKGLRPADPTQADSLFNAYNSLGFAMLGAQEYAAAKALFEKQVARRQSEPNSYLGLGSALLELQEIDSAIAALERGLQLDSLLNAHYRLGVAYQIKGDRAKAKAKFLQALAFQPQGRAADAARKRLEALAQN